MFHTATFVRQFLICLSIFSALTTILLFASPVRLGFFGFVALTAIGTVFTTLGVLIGDAFRRFVMPDAYVTRGVADSLKKRVFWSVGPQTIGWFIAFIATSGFMTRVLGYPTIL